MKKLFRNSMTQLAIGLGLLASPLSAHANTVGVFNIPQFLSPGAFAIGVEPQLSLGDEPGLGVNLRYGQGLNDITNFQGILGTGGGNRRLRFGGNMIFDFFPDIDGQPGIGIATQILYVKFPESGQLEMTAIPYLHKTFWLANQNEINPFVAVPIGMGFSGGRYRALSSLVVGSMFKNSEKIRTSIELGVAINNTDTYLSAGVTYYH